MVDLTSIKAFEWDEGNSRKSAVRHGVTQAEAEQVFFNEPMLLLEDVKHSRDEPRFHALYVAPGIDDPLGTGGA